MSRTFRNVPAFYTSKEVKSNPEYYKRIARVTKKNHRVKVEKFDSSNIIWNWKTCGSAKEGKLSGWNDYSKSVKKTAKRMARAQQKSMLRKDVGQHYIDIELDEIDQWNEEMDLYYYDEWYDEIIEDEEWKDSFFFDSYEDDIYESGWDHYDCDYAI